MLRLLRKMIARMSLAGALLLSLAFAAPAFAVEICIDTDCAASTRTAFEVAPDNGAPCPDCGPACANGCCHAQHAATAPDVFAPSPTRLATRTAELWMHEAAPPLARPAGPERPPRL
ncbi:hypothetical protein [Brevundimonas sp. NIBR11]|uniref:hypothetical protein n=1 Tax=Brevundimonas sp. NIBR11 TaxID=3015999 RepID=UPI0022F03B93|nr:hypothetical protein [Brevundimonas sp. NIBR11]WGM30672.1 hypothetical protein KKHFBJBL_00902 [Brevundimonas sp. NIBR11]